MVIVARKFWSDTGEANSAREQAKQLMKLEVELSTVVHGDPLTTAVRETEFDVPAISIPTGNTLVMRMSQMADYVLSKRAARILLSLREDLGNDCIVHCHNLFPDAFLGKELEERRASFVTTIHGTLRGELQRFRKERPVHFRELTYRLGCYSDYNVFTTLLRRSRSHLIALSAVNAADIMRQGVPASRVHIIPNGADLEVYRPYDSFEARERLGLPADRSVILTMCEVQPRKGLHVLVKAASAIVRESPEAYFVVVGKLTSDLRWYVPYLRRLLSKFALSDHFKFTGFVAKKDLPLYVNAADLFVLPSYAEGAPLVIPNAMACGCPVVATESSSAGYLPKHLTVSDGDHTELAQKISFLLQNPKERRSVGEKMREKAVSELSWAKIARRIYALYEKIANDNSG